MPPTLQNHFSFRFAGLLPAFCSVLLLSSLCSSCSQTEEVVECDLPISNCLVSPVNYTEVPNASFETWQYSADEYYQPDPTNFWATNNETSSYYEGGAAVQPVEGEGAYLEEGKAAMLVTRATLPPLSNHLLLEPGLLFSGKYTASLTDPLSATLPGRPFNRRISRLTGYYRYLPQGNDRAGMYIYLRACNSFEDECGNQYTKLDTIGSGVLLIADETPEYARFTIDVSYTSTDTPDDVVIFFTSSAYYRNGVGFAGSTLYLDAIEATYE